MDREYRVKVAMKELARMSVLFQVSVQESLNNERTLADRHQFASHLKRIRKLRDTYLHFLTPAERANL